MQQTRYFYPIDTRQRQSGPMGLFVAAHLVASFRGAGGQHLGGIFNVLRTIFRNPQYREIGTSTLKMGIQACFQGCRSQATVEQRKRLQAEWLYVLRTNKIEFEDLHWHHQGEQLPAENLSDLLEWAWSVDLPWSTASEADKKVAASLLEAVKKKIVPDWIFKALGLAAQPGTRDSMPARLRLGPVLILGKLGGSRPQSSGLVDVQTRTGTLKCYPTMGFNQTYHGLVGCGVTQDEQIIYRDPNVANVFSIKPHVQFPPRLQLWTPRG